MTEVILYGCGKKPWVDEKGLERRGWKKQFGRKITSRGKGMV